MCSELRMLVGLRNQRHPGSPRAPPCGVASIILCGRNPACLEVSVLALDLGRWLSYVILLAYVLLHVYHCVHDIPHCFTHAQDGIIDSAMRCRGLSLECRTFLRVLRSLSWRLRGRSEGSEGIGR